MLLAPRSEQPPDALSSWSPSSPPPPPLPDWPSHLSQVIHYLRNFTFMKDQNNSSSQRGYLLLLVHRPKKASNVNTLFHRTSEESSLNRYFFLKIIFCNTCTKSKSTKERTIYSSKLIKWYINKAHLNWKKTGDGVISKFSHIPVPPPLYPSLGATVVFFGGGNRVQPSRDNFLCALITFLKK